MNIIKGFVQVLPVSGLLHHIIITIEYPKHLFSGN